MIFCSLDPFHIKKRRQNKVKSDLWFYCITAGQIFQQEIHRAAKILKWRRCGNIFSKNYAEKRPLARTAPRACGKRRLLAGKGVCLREKASACGKNVCLREKASAYGKKESPVQKMNGQKKLFYSRAPMRSPSFTGVSVPSALFLRISGRRAASLSNTIIVLPPYKKRPFSAPRTTVPDPA